MARYDVCDAEAVVRIDVEGGGMIGREQPKRVASVMAGACIVLVLTASSALAQTWAPPVGIPMPSFGVRETARPVPNPWTTETPGFYFINNTHPAATDAVQFGTPGRPRVTMPQGVDPGSVVEVRGGPYSTGGRDIPVGGNGTAAAPIFYRGVGKPRIDGGDRSLNVWGSYVVVEGFEFVNLQIAMVGQHQAIRDNEVRNKIPKPGGCGIFVGTARDIVVLRNYIHHNGDPNLGIENDIHGVLVGASTERVWVVDNEMFANGGSSIQVNSATSTMARLVYIGRNRMHEEGESGIVVKSAEDVIISQNEVWGFRPTQYPTSGSDGTAIIVDDQNAWNNLNNRIWVLNNYVHDSTVGIRTQSYAYVMGNVIRHVQNAGILSFGGHDVHTEHNTMYNVGRGLEKFGGNVGNKAIFANNIVNARTWDDVKVSGNGALSSVLAYSLFQAPTVISWGGGTFNLASFIASHSCEGCREGDPRFVNPAAGDFRLGANSPAIGRATPSAVYAAFQSLYGVSIGFDVYGRSRPGADGRWDMGAHESDGGGGAPSPPSNVRIIR